MGGVILYEQVEDSVAVGAGESEQVHVVDCHARQFDESLGLRGVEPLRSQRGRLAETSGRKVEAIAGGVGGGVGSYAHELLEREQEGDGRVGHGAGGSGDAGHETVNVVIEQSVGLTVAQQGGEEIAGEENDCGGNRIVEHHDARRHHLAHRLERAVLAYIYYTREGGAGEHERAATASSRAVAVIDDNGYATGLARQAMYYRTRVVILD